MSWAQGKDTFARFYNPLLKCNGDCAIQVFGGRILRTSMLSIYGIKKFEPLWKWDWGREGILAGAISRRLVSFGDLVDIEVEAGLAKRFGDADQAEFWSSLNYRWKAFPWNDTIYTTAAMSAGVSFATGISDHERNSGDRNGRGSRFLFYLSPEITFAHPERKDWELLFRIHHRSGGRIFFGKKFKLFNSVDGGSSYGTLGIRHRF